jgi:phosphate:Na+ symporter
MGELKSFVEAFSGLGLFLFGMVYLESQIRLSAGRAFKSWVRGATRTRFRSLMAGLTATAIFQSSSVVTLMALSLIGAGLMSLEHAIAVIFGANIGTTVTAWIVGFVGFKLDIRLLSYAFVGIGGLGSVLSEEGSRTRAVFNGMVGFGLIFLGLEGMKESFSGFAERFDIATLPFEGVGWYALIGFGLTALIQSSSAAIAIVQSALFAHLIGFEAAAAFVVGANVGTTVTAILGAIGGSPDKKRTALAHFLFNVSTGLVALALLAPLIRVTDLLLSEGDPVLRIALFHTIFNLLGVVLWYPFIPVMARWLGRFFVRRHTHATRYLHDVSPKLPEVAVEALRKENRRLAREVAHFALLAVGIPPAEALGRNTSIEKLLDRPAVAAAPEAYARAYRKIRRLEGEILRFIAMVRRQELDPATTSALERCAKVTAYLATAAKAIKDMLPDLQKWEETEEYEAQAYLRDLRYQIVRSVQAFDAALRDGDTSSMEALEAHYRRIAHSYRHSLETIANLADNRKIPSEMTTIALNDLHLSKSFSKSLRNAARIVTLLLKEESPTPTPEN